MSEIGPKKDLTFLLLFAAFALTNVQSKLLWMVEAPSIASHHVHRKHHKQSSDLHNRQSPRRDNSKGNVIDPSNTNRAYEIILLAMNGIFIHINNTFIWIGIPEPHLRRFRLAAGADLC